MKVEVAVLGSPVPNSPYRTIGLGHSGRQATFEEEEEEEEEEAPSHICERFWSASTED